MRLIDADALMEVIREHDYPLRSRFNSTDNGMFTLGIQQAVYEAPTIDPVKRGRWIPVSEGLPKKSGSYMTCDFEGNIHIFQHDPECPYPFFIRPDNERYYQPTHWMPIPEPPRKDDEE